MGGQTLQSYLTTGALAEKSHGADIAGIILSLAAGATEVRKLTNQGALNSGFAGSRDEQNSDGDIQKNLDVVADNIFLEAMRGCAVAIYGSEEAALPILLDPKKPFALTVDPLDGSSNIETNVSIGTIFSILPVVGDVKLSPEASVLQAGNNQVAAGFFIYGPQLSLVLTVGNGTKVFIHSPKTDEFLEAYPALAIPPKTAEYAINASNHRHWDAPIRLYIDDCIAGSDGPREKEFNMRWIASLVADCYRILIRGGIFLYPGDSRPGYTKGRLRLVYEANPVSFVVEQAGGSATDGVNRILDLQPTALHERTPLVFGSSQEVERVSRYHIDPSMISDRSPLFGKRSLFRE